MNEFAQLIQELLDVQGLPNNYNWPLKAPARENLFLPEPTKMMILEIGASYEQNIQLKRAIHQNQPQDIHQFYLWAVKHWGGIRGTWHNHYNNDCTEFVNLVLTQGLIPTRFSSKLSSLSKVASFLHPEQYAIFDARVAYTLNWLTSKAITRGIDLDLRFYKFDVNRSGNQRIQARPYKLIFDKLPSLPFHSEATKYYEYCSLLQQINPLLFPQYPAEIYRTEMLLFASINVVYNDLGAQAMGWEVF